MNKLTNPGTFQKTLAALASTALLIAGCGSSDGSGDAASSSPATPTSTGAPELTDQQTAPERLVVKVSIAGGRVTPTNAQLKAAVGEAIVFQVDSDVADQLHVHSNPEHTFTIDPKSGQSYQFTVTIPGKVDVELHELNRTIATIEVQ